MRLLRTIFTAMLLIPGLLSGCASYQAVPTPVPVTIRFAYLGQEDDYGSLAQEF